MQRNVSGDCQSNRWVLVRALVWAVVFVALAGPRSVQAVIDSGMVLFKMGTGEKEALELVYLSTGRRVVLVDGLVKYAKFSPDGTRIALVKDTPSRAKRGHTMNLDGSNLLDMGFSTNDIHWCGNGYLYWGNMGVKRMPEDGGAIEQVWALNEDNWYPTPIPGLEVSERTADLSITTDGRWVVGTSKKRRDGVPGGYAMMAFDLVNMTAYSPAEPCQGAISTLGARMTVGNGGHHTYRAFPPLQEYAEFDNGNTWSGCGSDRLCPVDEGVVGIKQYLCDLYGVDDPGSFDCSTPRWCRADDDIVTLNAIPKDPSLPDSVFGAFVIEFAPGEWSSCTYTKVGPIGIRIEDYFPGEIDLSDAPYVLTPLTMSFDVEAGSSVLPPSKTATVVAQSDLTGTATLSGQPAWLDVTVTAVDARTVEFVNTLVSAELPGEGVDSATITVTPEPGATPVTYTVYLDVAPEPLPPISILSPAQGAVYTVGDTLRVSYTTNDDGLQGVVVNLSVDEGETYVKLHTTEALPTGANQTFDYVLTSALFNGAATQVFDGCLLMLTNYPTGYDSFSPLFTIQQSTSATAFPNRAVTEGVTLSPAAATPAASFTVNSRTPATVILLSIRGRLVQTWQVGAGTHTLSARHVPAGHYLVEARMGDGRSVVMGMAAVGGE